MTKEELEKEAIAKYKTGSYPQLHPDIRAFIHGYLAGAEPREKQIEIDAEQIRALQKQNGELTDELTKKSNTNHQLIEQMAELNERCSELETQLEREKNLNQCLSDHNEQLRELIEKMKCCPTCDNNKEEHTPEEHYRCKTCKKFCNWELAD